MILNVIHDTRVSGRTTTIINKAVLMYQSAVIVCPDKYRCDAAKKILKENFGDHHNVRVITFGEFLRKELYGQKPATVFFDDLDASLDFFMPGNVVVDTIVTEKPFDIQTCKDPFGRITAIKTMRKGGVYQCTD